MPTDGQALTDLLGPQVTGWFEARAQTLGDGYRVPHDPPDADRRTDVLIAALRQPLAVRNPEAARLPRAYIACLESRGIPLLAHFEEAAARAKPEGWTYHDLPSGHMPMQTMPNELAETLHTLA